MMTSVLKTEFHEHKGWYIGWIVGLVAMDLLFIYLYPGDEAMKEFVEILQDPTFQFLLGQLKGDNPNFTLWISIISPFLALIFAIFGILLGVRIVTKPNTDETSEIVMTTPVRWTTFLTAKVIVAVALSVVLVGSWFVPLSMDLNGNHLEFELLWELFWWGSFFTVMALFIGMFIGNLSGSMGKGSQNGILLVLFMFAEQLVVSAQQRALSDIELFTYTQNDVEKAYSLYNLLMDVNPMSWYEPASRMLGGELEEKSLWIIGTVLVGFAIVSYLTYIRRDMIKNRGLITIGPIFRRKKVEKVKPSKSVRNSIFTFWGRIFEKKLPHTADIIYSDRRALFILTIAVLMIWPLQLLAYTGDVSAAKLVTGFDSGFYAVFLYGYNSTDFPPWMWWLGTQALGTHFIIFTPMVIRWIRSVPARDMEDGTGDLVGSLPIKKKQVVFQRLLGVFLELIWINMWLSFWYVISVEFVESRVGDVIVEADLESGIPAEIFAFDNPFATEWVVVAIFAATTLYMFLVTSGVVVSLALGDKGQRYAKAMVFFFLLLFIGVYSTGNEDIFWISLVYGLYNPMQIAIEETLTWGIGILLFLNAVALVVVNYFTRNFTWIKQGNE